MSSGRLQKELERCAQEHLAIQDYCQPLAWLNAIGEADWEAERYLIQKEMRAMEENQQAAALNELARICHEANKKWWADVTKPPCNECQGKGWVHTNLGEPNCAICGGLGYPRKERNVGELLMLSVSELAEALEGHRKNLPDDKLPHRPMFEVEIADCFIRLFDLCAGLKLDIGGAFVEKMAFNAQRPDHKIENRLATGGKAY